MKWFLKKVFTILSVYYADMLEYRAEIFLWVLSGSLPIILMGVWVEAAQGGKFVLSATEFARYFFAVFQIRQFTNVWVIWDFEQEVIEGKLSFKLLQPFDPVWHHIARHIAEKFTRLPLSIFLTFLFFALYPQAFWIPNILNIFLCLMTIVMAFTLRFLIQYTFAMGAFWTERAAAIQQFWLLFDIFLSGVAAPLDVFPSTVRDIVMWTPFPYTVYFPVALLLDFPVNIINGFLIMLGWISIFAILNRWLWKLGLKQYSGMGA
ncbi:ABC transporter permease [Crocosphaera sp. XPORK-15E]|uniref:ABC transporter permease n=1 Tax=Crocosphaera sp. XPORK-15E TaxID=3110247 RepID=UPI002B1F6843|nr:ABC-2 family transporter protein [Crocosphaera sp. XPORK-15E]MEA5535040.1 ABC-2 family transporter protein [Crocosphaera sp. XPORK-15E]